MTNTTDAIKASKGAACGRDVRVLQDDELALVGGGDMYMHSPRGSSGRSVGGGNPAVDGAMAVWHVLLQHYGFE